MVDFAHTWKALVTPGVATSYFDMHRNTPFQASATTYSAVNAWWLAELCRLVYRQERDEIGNRAQSRTRTQILNEVGLDETDFFNHEGTQCALVSPLSPAQGEFTVVVFRGTNHIEDWLDNIKAISVTDFQPEPWPRGGRVHVGFREALDRVWMEVAQEVSRRGGPLFYTGHSLGAALATLAAGRYLPRAVYTFGSPLVGDPDFAATLATCPIYRVVNNRDVVTTVPPPEFGFCHAGELHYIAHDGRMVTNPLPADIAADHLRTDPSFENNRSWWNRLVGPAEFLEDHAPVNYVAHLERALS